MPRRARWYIGRRLMSSPSKMTRPPSAGIMPMVILKLVVLPAPFLPRRPTISASLTLNDNVIDDLAAGVNLHKPGNVKEFHLRLSVIPIRPSKRPTNGARRHCA